MSRFERYVYAAKGQGMYGVPANRTFRWRHRLAQYRAWEMVGKSHLPTFPQYGIIGD